MTPSDNVFYHFTAGNLALLHSNPEPTFLPSTFKSLENENEKKAKSEEWEEKEEEDITEL